MSQPAPTVECHMQHPVLRVPDVLAAADFYVKALGFQPGFTWGDPPAMAGVNLGEVSVHLGQGTASPAGCSVYFVVGDADELYQFQNRNGVQVLSQPEDRAWGLREYTVRDLNGYQLTFGHRLPEGPPLVVERVELALRLEKRLAAVLADLAGHKRMSVDSCLEETLLHTFEQEGDGVPSPHSKRTLDYIQQLKQKHGLDYDTHASYRFVEKR